MHTNERQETQKKANRRCTQMHADRKYYSQEDSSRKSICVYLRSSAFATLRRDRSAVVPYWVGCGSPALGDLAIFET